jgi:hypothetical protein
MGQIAFLLSSTLILISCAAPIIISGQDLPPEQQSLLRARRGINISRIGAEATDGRYFSLAPGSYSLQLTSKQDLGSADRSMASVLNILECEVEIEFLPGEEVQLSGRVRTGSFDQSGAYSQEGFHTEISLQSSIRDRSAMVDTSDCKSWIDCDHVDKSRMMPISCKSSRDAE